MTTEDLPPDEPMPDDPGRSGEAHDKEQGEGLGKPDTPPGQEDKPEADTLPVEPEVEPH